MAKYELGVVTAHPLVYLWKQMKTILKTWAWCRQNGFPANKWYGVYEIGTEIVAAQTGCTGSADYLAKMITLLLNEHADGISGQIGSGA